MPSSRKFSPKALANQPILCYNIGDIDIFTRNEEFFRMNANHSTSRKKSKAPTNRVQAYPARRLTLPYAAARSVLALRGVKLRLTDGTGGKLTPPCVVLCNHGSFIDFIYAGALLRKHAPHFVVARLYFYRKSFGRLLRSVGCFPKSMFETDLESAQNCLRVLRSGGVLAMMPEARLSTAGRFEDIQPGTYSFLKKAGAPIYTVRINGDYLADPKWGKGLRRGSVVEATLELLADGETVKAMSVEELRELVESRLTYDELAWLATRPTLRYRSRRMAEGLENILTTCPLCGGVYTLSAKRKSVKCARCGRLTDVSPRYAFSEGFPYRDFAEWYYDQLEKLRVRVLADPDYSLSSPVTYYLPPDECGSPKGKRREGLCPVGRGVCTLSRQGLVYRGTVCGEEKEISFPAESIYRLLFGAGINFELYKDGCIHYFVPDEPRSCVEWYMTSLILTDEKANAERSAEAAASI
jgi:1-acyl-sn-glycerol-3-phosphate acyltransferase